MVNKIKSGWHGQNEKARDKDFFCFILETKKKFFIPSEIKQSYE